MFQNYLKIAFRKLSKNKTHSLILISGLAVGMAACLLLMQYVSYEWSFDRFHSKSERIYRVVNERFQEGKSVQKGTITYPTIGKAMLADFPEIINATRLGYSSDMMVTIEEEVNPVGVSFWADEHFLEIFDFTLLASEGIDLLKKPNEIILTRNLADQFFPQLRNSYQQIIGKEVIVDRYPDPFKIVGVLEKIPSNSTLQFELLTSYASAIKYWGEGADNSWTFSDFYHIVLLENQTDVRALEAKFAAFSDRHFKGDEVSGSVEVFSLQGLNEAHLNSTDLEYEIGATKSGKAVLSLLIIAFFILLLAWINYVNLASVKALEGAKEVGVRKSIGAKESQLVFQFLTEAIVVNGLAFLCAIGLTFIIKPWFSSTFAVDASEMRFFQNNAMHQYLFLGLGMFIMLGVFASGIYPAWLLSKTQLSGVIKGVFRNNSSSVKIRKGLVVFQFAASIALISATWIVSQQVRYMSQQDLGIDIEQIVILNSPEMTDWDSTFIERINSFKTTLVQHPNIVAATTTNREVGERMGRVFGIQKMGSNEGDQSYTSNVLHADFDFTKTYKIEPISGRFFKKTDYSQDWDALNKIVLTEEAVKLLNYTSNEEAVGSHVRFFDKNWTIAGVLPDFHQRSLHHKIEPIVFLPAYSTGNAFSIRMNGASVEETMQDVKKTYANFFPGNTFSYEFLDESYASLYAEDVRFGRILSFFTFLTMFIACLGLFGLASYTTLLRSKEIGVRKVLGASTSNILYLLSYDFLKLVVLAILFAVPIAWYISTVWLNDFAYRTPVSWWIFALSGMLAVIIAFGSIGMQAFRAAVQNPAQTLKSES